MFRGSSNHTIDPKGRLIIPSRFRDRIKSNGGNGVMVTVMDSCLFAFPFDAWYELEDRIMSLPTTNAYMRRFRRVFIGEASECKCDKQDRILIPPTLREYAKLEKEIVLVGALKHFEIWSKALWNAEKTELEDDLLREELSTEIDNLGL
ncbi:MAG: division/cell wall cluster transcriptional repressor MraZ [Desulfobacterales bacterium]|nr:division/cell wall cluster transcriptional repressor MraZ [Desulfobacterales bacterium]